ncbi:hypothetical protein [Nonomuraea sp. CA-141351]|uniref:hypothetical protein n=1 Tax=Nonomuraea sp. CA-141351 TaxID=3239996 RepID=UPI003D8E44BB
MPPSPLESDRRETISSASTGRIDGALAGGAIPTVPVVVWSDSEAAPLILHDSRSKELTA